MPPTRSRTIALAGLSVLVVAALLLPVPPPARGASPADAQSPSFSPGSTPVLPLSAAPLSALSSPNWRNLSASAGPVPPTVQGALVYDRSDGYAVWFGGTSPMGNRNETWAFAQGHWTDRTVRADAPPAPADGVAMAYDASDGYVLLLTSDAVPQTWIYRAGMWHNWTQVVNGTPASRIGEALAYDSTDGYVVLFSGWLHAPLGGSYLNDSYTYHAGSWTLLSVAGPTARAGAAVSDDPAGGGILLTGGTSGGEILTDTWTFANSMWTNVTQSRAPTLSTGGLAPAPGGALVGFGDTGCAMAPWGPCNVTDSYESGTWRSLPEAAAPTPRTGLLVAYDPADAMVLAFGGQSGGRGLSETWALGGPLAARIVGDRVIAGTDEGVEFDASGQGGYGNLSYAFQNEPVGCFPATIASISCDFGTAGNYTVGVTARDELGNQSSANASLQAYARLNGQVVTSQDVIDVGQSVLLQASSIGGIGPWVYAWYGLPPGCVSTALPDVTCAPTSPGFFGISATITDSLGTVVYTAAVTVTVNPPPNAFASADRTYGPAPLVVNFTGYASGGTAPYSYRWDLGNGAVDTQGNTTASYVNPGSFLVTLTVTDARNLSASWTFERLIIAYPPLNVTAGASAPSFAVGTAVSFTASAVGGTGAVTVRWTFGDGAQGSGPTPAHSYGFPGSFTAVVVATDGAGEQASAFVTVDIASRAPNPAGPWTIGGADPLVWGALAAGVAVGAVAVFLWTRRRRFRPEPAR